MNNRCSDCGFLIDDAELCETCYEERELRKDMAWLRKQRLLDEEMEIRSTEIGS